MSESYTDKDLTKLSEAVNAPGFTVGEYKTLVKEFAKTHDLSEREAIKIVKSLYIPEVQPLTQREVNDGMD